MQDSLGADVEVENLAVDSGPQAIEVAAVLEAVRDDADVRDAISEADAVLITVGHNDLAYNRLDDPCRAAPNYPEVDWAAITHTCVDTATDEYRRDLDSLLTEIDALRAGRPTMVRVTTVYNSAIGDVVDPTWNSPDAIEPTTYAVERMVAAQCEVAAQHGGSCADTYHALNGADGGASAQPALNSDATHLAQPGHDAFATTLIALGFSPLS